MLGRMQPLFFSTLSCVVLAALCGSCKTPRDASQTGQDGRSSRSGDIEINLVRDPNDCRETNWEILIYP